MSRADECNSAEDLICEVLVTSLRMFAFAFLAPIMLAAGEGDALEVLIADDEGEATP